MTTKLYYFDARGLAEPIRIILSYGGEEFEDIRAPLVTIPTPLPDEIKEKCTWGQVPLIEFDGKKLAQSSSITRYFAKKFNLVGSDDFEAAVCDEYVDTCRDALTSMSSAFKEKDPEKAQQLKEEAIQAIKEKYLEKFNSIIEANGGQRLVGKNLTWADIYLASIINNIEIIQGIELLKDYPAINAMSKSVFASPKIKAWIDKRPKTLF